MRERHLRLAPEPEGEPPKPEDSPIPEPRDQENVRHGPGDPRPAWSLPPAVSVAVHRVNAYRRERGGLLRIAARACRGMVVYGGLGLGRVAGVWWRWVTAAEHDAVLGSRPELVEASRARRRKVSLWATGGAVVGNQLLVAYDWPFWLAPAGLVATSAVIGGAVEAHARAKDHGGDENDASRELGTHPGSKAVRGALAAAGQLGKAGEIRILPPGVLRDQDSAVPAWIAVADLRQGVPASKAVGRQQEIAAAFGVDITQLDVEPVKGNANRVKFWVADFDPLTGEPITSPLKGRVKPFDAWSEKVVVGKDRRGRDVAFSLPERSILTGGEPGGGKSVSCNNVLCAASLDPLIDLRMVDGKGGADLLDYEPLCTTFLAEPDPRAMLEICTEIQDEMSDRYKQLKGLGERKLTREVAEATGLRLVLFHVDEIQFFAAARQKGVLPGGDDEAGAVKGRLGELIVDALWDIVSRGRAAGFITSAATQRPAAEVVPTKLRDILSIRWALRCTTPQASDTILGQGWAGQGFNAARIDVMQRGAGLLLAEGSVPIWLRSCFLSDADVRAATRLAYRFRDEAGTLPVRSDNPAVRLLNASLRAIGEAERIPSMELLARLASDERWAHLADDPAELARLLRPHGVKPSQLWIPDGDGSPNKQGYEREALVTALNRLTGGR